jgi:hypothetical protein
MLFPNEVTAILRGAYGKDPETLEFIRREGAASDVGPLTQTLPSAVEMPDQVADSTLDSYEPQEEAMD